MSPDITMCTGENCPKVNQCYRAQAKPDKYMQSYFAAPPVDEEGECDCFWPMED